MQRHLVISCAAIREKIYLTIIIEYIDKLPEVHRLLIDMFLYSERVEENKKDFENIPSIVLPSVMSFVRENIGTIYEIVTGDTSMSAAKM